MKVKIPFSVLPGRCSLTKLSNRVGEFQVPVHDEFENQSSWECICHHYTFRVRLGVFFVPISTTASMSRYHTGRSHGGTNRNYLMGCPAPEGYFCLLDFTTISSFLAIRLTFRLEQFQQATRLPCMLAPVPPLFPKICQAPGPRAAQIPAFNANPWARPLRRLLNSFLHATEIAGASSSNPPVLWRQAQYNPHLRGYCRMSSAFFLSCLSRSGSGG
ncbi:hypothetical protein V8F06_000977 [Rhypophila decipiens]